MNKCIFCGHIARDIELTTTAGGMQVAKFSIAVQRMKKDDPADFLNMVAFGKTAETIANYFSKGSKILVETHVQTGKYVNKDGANVYTTDFIVDRFEFCGGKSDNQNNNQSNYQEDIVPMDDNGEDLPF
ncbi:single-stranded DNA-binding protein [Clostridium phage CB452P1]|nr:single-stranded DNA-binding protein [Clostridium phage CB452P1]